MSTQPQPASPSDHVFYHSEGDDQPISHRPTDPGTSENGVHGSASDVRRVQQTGRGQKMAQALAFEKVDEHGNPEKRYLASTSCKPHKAKRRRMDTGAVVTLGSSDEGDHDFEGPEGSESDSESDGDLVDVPLSNAEVADILPSKTIPSTGRGASAKRKRSKRIITDEETENIDGHNNRSNSIEAGKRATNTKPQIRRNPIYNFYEKVNTNSNGEIGNPGDMHYKCLHGGRKVLTITRKMKYSLNGLIGNLKTASSPMYRLYLTMKERTPDQITTEEILVASGQQVIDPGAVSAFISQVESANEGIQHVFEKQAQAAAGPWDQEMFEELLAKWIVATDQPFHTVEEPEFRTLLSHTHHPSPELKIPHRNAVKRRIMKMGEDTIEATKESFATHVEGKISISLDAWTSSNNYAFMAIVAHFVTRSGKLEELLIDFRELEGEHSGANMAEAVWETLTCFGIEDRIMAFMLDNASNNDTLIDGIVNRARQQGIKMKADWIRLHCMPHTVHLAALKLLEGIGALSTLESKKAMSRRGNYQDSITAPISRASDDAAVAQDDEDEQGELLLEIDATSNVLSAVEKLRKIIRAIRSSPQRKQNWLHQVTMSQQCKNNGDPSQQPLVLILDVKTRWSSTHQMMHRALEFRKDIDDFVACNRDLRALELSEDEWGIIAQVSDWLGGFRAATTQMSTSKQSMLSSTLAIFRGLQEHVQQIYSNLPASTPQRIKDSLLDAHWKLSDYYYRYDQSPFYTWAALLDPRISYEGVCEDYANDPSLLGYLESSKALLHAHYIQHYSSLYSDKSPSKVNFTLRYKKKDTTLRDELDEYFKLPREDFDLCNPLEWWVGQWAQFPNLCCLARDILSIPGSAVAVERIFSGGRDTISLRRASLQPGTIRTLMVLKQHLRLARSSPSPLS